MRKSARIMVVVLGMVAGIVSQTQLAVGKDNVTLQLRWTHGFQFAGYYAALAQGYYDSEGLDVRFLEGKGRSISKAVMSGEADFGVDSSNLVLNRLRGEPVVVLASIFQHSAHVLAVKGRQQSVDPHCLVGENLWMARGPGSAELHAIFLKEGIPLDDLRTTFNYKNPLPPIADQQFAAYDVYRCDEPYQLKRLGIPYVFLDPRDYGIDFYGDCLFTSEREIEYHPERVEAFRRASLRGWRYAMDHPEEVVNFIMTRFVSDRSRAHLLFEAEQIRLIVEPDLVEIGHSNPARWKQIAATYASLGLADSTALPDAFIYDPQDRKERIEATVRKVLFATIGVILAGLGLFLFLNRKLVETVERRTLEFKQSEIRYHTLFESATDAIILTDPETGRIMDANRKAVSLLGIPKDEIVGMHHTELHPPEFSTHCEVAFRECVSDCEPGLHETVMLARDGRRIHVEVSSGGVMDVLGRKMHFGIFRDISERKQIAHEARLLREQKQVMQKMEALGTLAGGVAHDFNNLLVPIMGYVELMKVDLPENHPHSVPLNAIYQAANRARALIDQILAFSRQGESPKQPVKVHLIVQEVMRLIRSSLPLSIEARVAIDKVAGFVLSNPVQIHQMVMNLVANAIHAMEGGQGVLEVALEAVLLDRPGARPLELTPGRYARLRVADTGPGIPSAIRNRIFEPYFTTKEKGKGTGLGLATVHGIAKGLGGSVVVKSELGNGTVFEVYLPVTEAAMDPPGPLPPEGLSGDGRSILLVDDELMVMDLMQAMLDSMGHRVTARTSSIEALKAFQADPCKYDLVITDLTMPNMNGLQLAGRLHEIRPDIKIIMFTGFSDKLNSEQLKAYGIDGLLHKPALSSELAQKIREVTGTVGGKQRGMSVSG